MYIKRRRPNHKWVQKRIGHDIKFKTFEAAVEYVSDWLSIIENEPDELELSHYEIACYGDAPFVEIVYKEYCMKEEDDLEYGKRIYDTFFTRPEKWKIDQDQLGEYLIINPYNTREFSLNYKKIAEDMIDGAFTLFIEV